MRIPAPRNKSRTANLKSFPAPVGGWVANQNLAAPDPKLPAGAVWLENWFPTATGVRMRGGSQLYASIGAGSPVASLFSFSEGAVHKLFAANGTGIFDITSIADALVPPAPVVSGLTGGKWSVVQFSTAGGTFLRGVNGVDTPRVYDGSAWATTPALAPATGETLDVNKLSYAWAFKKRLFFAESGTLNAWYLDVDTISGDLHKLPLGGVFQRGGSLLFGASWSLNDNSGLTASCVFVTTEGEVAVYQGSNPGSISDWSLVGVYRIGRPLGANAWMRAGGDLAIATDIGFIPLSQATQRDTAALGPAAVSYPIETEWNGAVSSRAFDAWHCEVWPAKQMVVVAPPSNGANPSQMFVANARTGAWCKYTGWNATCLHAFGDRLFFGSTDGMIIEAEVTGADMGLPYTATCIPLFDTLRSPASLKTVGLARATILAPAAINDRLSIQTDYVFRLPPVPDDVISSEVGLWGAGKWGQSQWSTARAKSRFVAWRSVSGRGYALTPALQITSGKVAPPEVELVSIEITFTTADIVT